jgi:hypothetical protein
MKVHGIRRRNIVGQARPALSIWWKQFGSHQTVQDVVS